VVRLSQRAKQDGKTQGDRPDGKAAGKSVVAIATDEEDPQVLAPIRNCEPAVQVFPDDG
jgi:hypothetical protein